MNMMFWKLVRELLAEKKLTQTGIARTLDIEVRTFQDWVYSKKLPDTESAKKIADFLGVSLDYLLTGVKSDSEPLSDNDKKLLDLYHRVPSALEPVVFDFFEALTKNNNPPVEQ